ncbi:MAG TPA: hypothetical protein VNC60_06120 [Actinomycetota bacterium]|nr:hypothetical protein [Actinomycetota bacterium]
MDVTVLEGVERHVLDHGGTLWVWLDPHGGLGGPALIYLDAATEAPGATKATRRMRSARRTHRFTEFDCPGFRLLCDFGKFDPPSELHLELKRFPRRHVDAFWDGKIFVDADLPEEPIRKERP